MTLLHTTYLDFTFILVRNLPDLGTKIRNFNKGVFTWADIRQPFPNSVSNLLVISSLGEGRRSSRFLMFRPAMEAVSLYIRLSRIM